MMKVCARINKQLTNPVIIYFYIAHARCKYYTNLAKNAFHLRPSPFLAVNLQPTLFSKFCLRSCFVRILSTSHQIYLFLSHEVLLCMIFRDVASDSVLEIGLLCTSSGTQWCKMTHWVPPDRFLLRVCVTEPDAELPSRPGKCRKLPTKLGITDSIINMNNSVILQTIHPASAQGCLP